MLFLNFCLFTFEGNPHSFELRYRPNYFIIINHSHHVCVCIRVYSVNPPPCSDAILNSPLYLKNIKREKGDTVVFYRLTYLPCVSLLLGHSVLHCPVVCCLRTVAPNILLSFLVVYSRKISLGPVKQLPEGEVCG